MTKLQTILAIALLSFAGIQSCEKSKNETKISAYNGGKSHHTGENCMECHKKHGSGEGWFTAAGSVYDTLKTTAFPNTTIKLFTGPNGTGDVKATIEVDGLGNFYTTENIDFSNGLYPSVMGNSFAMYMSTATVTGECYSCHSVTTDRIWAY